jgi:hypothetical protein
MFKHERTECQCVDEEANRRIFWLDPGNPGRVYVYLSPDDAAGAADQFNRYGILEEMELPGPGDDRISAVTFECDLAVMIEKMLDGGFSEPEKGDGRLVVGPPALQQTARRGIAESTGRRGSTSAVLTRAARSFLGCHGITQ